MGSFSHTIVSFVLNFSSQTASHSVTFPTWNLHDLWYVSYPQHWHSL